MDTVDGKNLRNFTLWRCKTHSDHVLGVSERVKVSFSIGGRPVRYYSTRLMLFRAAVDLNADIPEEIEVCGVLDGRTMSMVWTCSQCKSPQEWYPDHEFVKIMAEAYLTE